MTPQELAVLRDRVARRRLAVADAELAAIRALPLVSEHASAGFRYATEGERRQARLDSYRAYYRRRTGQVAA